MTCDLIAELFVLARSLQYEDQNKSKHGDRHLMRSRIVFTRLVPLASALCLVPVQSKQDDPPHVASFGQACGQHRRSP
jgi:hypothetical protein